MEDVQADSDRWSVTDGVECHTDSQMVMDSLMDMSHDGQRCGAVCEGSGVGMGFSCAEWKRNEPLWWM